MMHEALTLLTLAGVMMLWAEQTDNRVTKVCAWISGTAATIGVVAGLAEKWFL